MLETLYYLWKHPESKHYHVLHTKIVDSKNVLYTQNLTQRSTTTRSALTHHSRTLVRSAPTRKSRLKVPLSTLYDQQLMYNYIYIDVSIQNCNLFTPIFNTQNCQVLRNRELIADVPFIDILQSTAVHNSPPIFCLNYSVNCFWSPYYWAHCSILCYNWIIDLSKSVAKNTYENFVSYITKEGTPLWTPSE